MLKWVYSVRQTILKSSSFFSMQMSKPKFIKVSHWIGNRIYNQDFMSSLLYLQRATLQEASMLKFVPCAIKIMSVEVHFNNKRI